MGFVVVGLVVLAVLLLGAVGPRLAWGLRWLFLPLEWLIWWLPNPDRRWLVGGGRLQRWTHRGLVPLRVVWWLAAWLVLLPVRILSAAYWDLGLFPTLALRDQLAALFFPPRLRGGRLKRWTRWTLTFPGRALQLLLQSPLLVLQALARFVVACVVPTHTMFHGTSFGRAAVPMAQRNVLFVGPRAHAGAGIYFARERRVAEHYARSAVSRMGGTPSVLVVRVTLTPVLQSGVLPGDARPGSRGAAIRAGVCATVEHWRDDLGGWWEHCLLRPGEQGRYVRTWRVRPVGVLVDGVPKRLWKGVAPWPGTAGGVLAVTLASAVFVAVVVPVLVL